MNKVKNSLCELFICVALVLLMKFTKFAHQQKWSRGRAARQWSATPSTAVRIRSRPQQKNLFIIYVEVFFMTKNTVEFSC